MYKLTVFVKGRKKTVVLSQCLEIERDDPHIFVKTATVYWDYNNVFPKYNDTIAYRGSTVRFEEGYWTFSMIKDKFTCKLGTTVLKASKYDSTCSLEVDGDFDLSKFGELLGFEKDMHIETNDILTSPNKVNINRGLRYVTIPCDLVSSDNNIDSEWRRSTVISSLRITTTQSLKGTVSHNTDIERRVPIDKGSYDRIEFSVEGDNSAKNIGSVLLEVYIAK